jgi:hypothetical protein
MSVKLIIRELSTLLECCKFLGLPQADIEFAHNLIEHHEFGIGFEYIATQLYGYNVAITGSLYSFIERIEVGLDLPAEEFSYLKTLIEEHLPEEIKDGIDGIIDGLNG